jgi:hypothetical protein
MGIPFRVPIIAIPDVVEYEGGLAKRLGKLDPYVVSIKKISIK